VGVVLGASERVLLARLAAYGRPPAHHYAPNRSVTVPAWSNRFNMLCDLRFVSGYVFAVVVVVLGISERVLAAAPGQFDRPPAHYDAPGHPGTFPACANRSSMPCE
jgi:hypothetical protein